MATKADLEFNKNEDLNKQLVYDLESRFKKLKIISKADFEKMFPL